MSVSGELLCSFELLKPLDSSALKSHIKKGRNKRQNMLNSPVSQYRHTSRERILTECAAGESIPAELLDCIANWLSIHGRALTTNNSVATGNATTEPLSCGQCLQATGLLWPMETSKALHELLIRAFETAC